MEPSIPKIAFWYDENIVNLLGMQSPISLYKSNNWNWETFISLLLHIQNNSSISYNALFGTIWHEITLMAGNGVEFVNLSEEGKYIYALNNKYYETVDFINDLRYKYKVLIGLDINELIYNTIYNDDIFFFTNYWYNTSIEGIQNFINEHAFMICENLAYKLIFNLQLYESNINLSYICAPSGPSVYEMNGKYYKNPTGQQMCYVITSSCQYPEAAAAYIGWVLSDEQGYENRKKYITDIFYNGSDELYQLGVEWAKDSGYIDLMGSFGPEFSRIIRKNIHNLLDDKIKKECQVIIDTYVNAFLGH